MSSEIDNTCPWPKCYNPISDDKLTGWVETVKDWEEVRTVFEVFKSLHFVGYKKGNFGKVNIPSRPTRDDHVEDGTIDESSFLDAIKSHYVRFSDYKEEVVPFDGVPFMVMAKYILGCVYVKDKHELSKRRDKKTSTSGLKADRPTSKKKGCPALVKVKEVIRFPEYKTELSSKFACDVQSKELRKAIQNGVVPQVEKRIYISFPSDDAHKNIHKIGKTNSSTDNSDNTINNNKATTTLSSKQTSSKKKPSTCAVSDNANNTSVSTLASKQTSSTKKKPSTCAVSDININDNTSLPSEQTSSTKKKHSTCTVSDDTINTSTSSSKQTSSTKTKPSTSTSNTINTSASTSSSKQTSSTKTKPSTSTGNTINSSTSTSSSKQTSSTKTKPSTSTSNTINTSASTSSAKQTSSTKTKPSTSTSNTINTSASTSSSKQTSSTKTKTSTSTVSDNTISPSTSPSPSKQLPSQKDYTYTQLANISDQMILNVYGVVKFFKPPYMTRGTDFCMVIKIVDPSLGKNDNGLLCNLFMKSRETLPNIVAVGDIIRMHRLKIINYHGNLQGTKSPGFSSLVFDGSSKDYQCRSSTPKYSFTKEDEKMVDRLRKWNLKNQKGMDTVQTLSSIEKTEYIDVSVQIVATVSIPDESCVALKVWDGTLIKNPTRWVDTDSYKFTWDTDLANKAKGFLVDIWVYDDHVSSVKDLKPGQYIKVCNLHAPLFQSDKTIELVVHRGTSYGRGVITIADDDVAVKRMARQFALVDQVRTDKGINSDGLSVKEQIQQGFRTQGSDPDGSAINIDGEVSTNKATNITEVVTVHQTSMAHGSQQNNNCTEGHDIEASMTSGSQQKSNVDQVSVDSEENTNVTETHDVVTVDQTSMSQDSVGNADRNGFHEEDPETTNICMQESATIILGHYGMKVVPISHVLQTTTSTLFKIRAKVISFEPFVKDFVKFVCPECNKSARQPKFSEICAVYLAALNSSWLSSPENTKYRRSPRLRDKTSPNASRLAGKSDYSVMTRSKRKLTPEQSTEEKPASTEDDFQPPKKYKRLVTRSGRKDTSLNLSDVNSSDVHMTINSPDEPSTSAVMQGTEHPMQGNEDSHLHEPSTPTAKRNTHRKRNASEITEKSTKNPVNTAVYFECPICSVGSEEVPILRPHYNFKLTLYDGTQVMQVNVQNEEAETFLDIGISAHLFVHQQNIKKIVTQMRCICPTKLTEGNKDLKNAIVDTDRPWLDCCIRGYYKRNNADIVIQHQLCDTKIVKEK